MITIPKEGVPQKDRKILEEIKILEEKYFTFDMPVPFCGMKVYPVTVRDYTNFLIVSDCFLLNKNETAEGIRSTHLEYLLKKMTNEEDGRLWSFKFSNLIEMVFHIKNGMKCRECGKVISFEEYFDQLKKLNANHKEGEPIVGVKCECGGGFNEVIGFDTDEKTKKKRLIVDGNVISSKDYDLLRKLCIYQNMPDYHDDSWVHPEIKADQAKKNEILAKKDGPNMANLERKIVCVAAKSAYKVNEIYDMTMRKFIMLLGVIDDAITYETTRIGLMTGLVSHKGPIDHWVYKKDKGMYGSAVDADDYVGKINQANGG